MVARWDVFTPLAAELTSALTSDPPDLVLADLPYGRKAAWNPPTATTADFLESLAANVPTGTIAVVITGKDPADRPRHPAFVRRGRASFGRRLVTVLQAG
jgi:hypothetical protein